VTKPKPRIATLFINGKAARIVGTIPGYIVVQIGTSRPICLSFAEFDTQARTNA
jgi:hypothetical protein